MDEQVSEQLVKENVANEEKKNLESLLNYVRKQFIKNYFVHQILRQNIFIAPKMF